MSEPARIVNASTRTYTSNACGVDFRLYVQPPMMEGPCPVIVSLDADLMFGAIAESINMLVAGAEIPPVLHVGIGYAASADPTFVYSRRTLDFSPIEDTWHQDQLVASGMSIYGRIEGGGAPDLLSFIESELLPWISSNYETTDDRTLVGHSMGGLFANYVLLERSALFNRYVIGSPWLNWAFPDMFDREVAAAERSDQPSGRVLFVCGEREAELNPVLPDSMRELFGKANILELAKRMHRQLSARQYPGLETQMVVMPLQTHFTGMLAGIPLGLKTVFSLAETHPQK